MLDKVTWFLGKALDVLRKVVQVLGDVLVSLSKLGKKEE
jgi:hypothetical protein